MKHSIRIYLASLMAVMAISLVSCNDDDDTMEPVGATHGELTLEYDNVVGNRDLALDTDTYTNAANEPFTVSTFNYYVSNIKFYKADGSSYVVPQDSSYFLIRESDPSSQEITFKNVPVGDYTAVEFMVGVDSLRSVSDVSKRIGVLDPAYSEVMYWAWNSGYIFMKLEGESDVIDTPNGKYNFHIGLFGGYETKTLNNLKTVKVDFGEHKASVTGELSPQIHLLTDVEKIFSGSTTVSLAENPVVMTSEYSKNIAANYTSMFSLDHIHAD